MNNEQLDLASIYGIPSCAGGDCSPGAVFTPTNPSPSTPGNRIPTLEEIAGYNNSAHAGTKRSHDRL